MWPEFKRKSKITENKRVKSDLKLTNLIIFWSVSFDDGKLTLEMPLTSSPVVDASSLSLGFKVGNTHKHTHADIYFV